MKKVLIIGYFWPYHRHGSGRMLGLAKYLPEFGWEPIILTAPLEKAPPPRFRIIETAYPGDIFSFWRKVFCSAGLNGSESITEQIKANFGITKRKSLLEALRTMYQEVFGYPDTDKRWFAPARKAASVLLEKEHVDTMISVWPITAHIVACNLKRRFSLPWVVDFPDPWSQNHNYPYGPIRRYFDQRLERKTLAGADIFTAATPEYALKQESFLKRKTYAITHGFDPEQVNQGTPLLRNKFTVTYTGTIYIGKQTPEKLFAAVSRLLAEKAVDSSDFEVRFYGQHQGWLDSLARQHGVEDIVCQYGRVSRSESIQKQRESHLVLLLNWEDQAERGVYPLKFFEYLAARRPILAAGGHHGDDIEKIIEDLKSGFYAATVEEIETELAKAYREYKEQGTLKYKADIARLDNYSYRQTAGKFAEIMEQVVKKNG